MIKRNTIVSDAVITILKESEHPLSVKNILNSLAESNLSPNRTTIYRLMDKLVLSGQLKSFISPTGVSYYEISNKCDDHNHHFFCSDCEAVFCLTSCNTPSAFSNLNNLLPNSNFVINAHHLSLVGTCSKCL